jgi:excisionase family DNA binding protein
MRKPSRKKYRKYDQTKSAVADPLLISIRDAANRLNIGHSMMYQILASGKLKARKLGARRLIAMADLHDFAKALPVDQRAQP